MVCSDDRRPANVLMSVHVGISDVQGARHNACISPYAVIAAMLKNAKSWVSIADEVVWPVGRQRLAKRTRQRSLTHQLV